MRPRIALGLAVATSLALHGVGLTFLPSEPKVQEKGGEGSGVAMLGSSFEELAAGTATAVETTETTEATSPAQTPRAAVAERTDASVPEPAWAPRAESAPKPPPEAAEPVRASESPAAGAESASAAPASASSAPAPTASIPDGAARIEQAPAAPAVETAPTEEAVPEAAAPVTPETTTEALPENDSPTSVYAAPSPPSRPDNLAPAAPEPEPPAPQRTDRQPQPRQPTPDENARQQAPRGQQDGNRSGNSSTEGNSRNQSRQGNAAAASYPGQVMATLQRTRKDRVRARGTATIAFSIAANGALSGLSVAQSSGSSEVDRAGLDVVRRAAPFPPPPAGAQRRFSFRFTGR